MRILITGGLGYIGTNLQMRMNDILLNFEVDVCDYGEVHSGDLPLAQHLSYDDIKKYDGIVHLAALSGLAACEENWPDAIEKNILTANNVFGKATLAKIPVVFTSSQAAKEPISSKYASLKATCEGAAEVYNNAGGMNYVLRLANVYGGDGYLDKKQTCVKQFITKYRAGKPLLVHGDGTQKRDFIHVDDVCQAILNVFAYRPIEKTPMDIGTGKETSIMELQAMFPRKQNQHYEFTEIRNVGADSSIADTSVAKTRINFEATRKIEDYIKEMILC